MKRLSCLAGVAGVVLGLLPPRAGAGEIGHYAPAGLSIRDFAMPAPGLWLAVYNLGYRSNRIDDRNGDAVRSISVGPATIDLAVDLDLYASAPTLIWVSDFRVLGARYGAYVEPQLTNSSLGAALSTATGSGRSVNESQFGMGDLFVQPLWLGWEKARWSVAVGYGFYAPVGRYRTETLTLPVVGPIEVEGSDNIGLGFWTHQVQGAVTFYPWEHRGTAAVAALTWEAHGRKSGFDLTPGQDLSLNWGVSQYLPLRKDKKTLLEVGLTGYSTWQVTDDEGSAARHPEVRDRAHAVGAQLGVTYVPWKAAVNLHYLREYATVDRFRGSFLGLNVAFGF